MASTTISLRTDSELKNQAETILNGLGMTINGTFNMLLNQIVREKSVPLSLSLSPQNTLYADLLVAEEERKYGSKGTSAKDLIKEMEEIIAMTEKQNEV